ncbi:MAG: NHL repeat-containing protein [Candidatus Riflebacteria bacterium]|nr:NHL repeat-containing protein [Candidatus Riflebacteria bacterium]
MKKKWLWLAGVTFLLVGLFIAWHLYQRNKFNPDFDGPTQIALSKTCDRIYIFDSKNKRILITDQDFKLINVVTHPMITLGWGMALGKDGDIILVNVRTEGMSTNYDERRASRISELLIFNSDGNFKRNISWKGDKGPIFYPQGVQQTPDGGFLVTDTQLNCIFKLDDSGKVISSFGKHGRQPGMLYNPSEVYLTFDGGYVVCDCYNSRIQKFSANGEFQKVLIEKGEKEGFVSFPQNFTFDDKGNFYCTESGNMRISVFDRDFKFIRDLRPGNASETDIFDFNGIEFNAADGKLYVVDSYNSSIHLFDSTGKWLEAVSAVKTN